MKKIFSFFLIFFIFSFQIKDRVLPPNFVYLTDYIPDVKLDLRYASNNNFMGRPVSGYKKPVCIVTKPTAEKLKEINAELKKYNLSILIYDAYRPQKAVRNFVLWAKDEKDTLMKKAYYPKLSKKELFKKGYIASKSRHSSGSTVDLTLYSLKYKEPLDMGSPYDYFGKESWVDYTNLTKEQKYNRIFLLRMMQKYGFRSYQKEWWHFTLKKEPYRNHYFDFDIW